MHDDFRPGTIWLVGAGPGDPDLLTRKAERLLRRADIVFHDALVGDGVLAFAPQAELVNVGKRSGRHSRDQGMIDTLIVEAALAGRRVVRLKGGDASIFGRSAEELAACAAHRVPVSICPGITAASAAAASGLASLTLRGEARQLTFLTAHARNDEPLDLDWAGLASGKATLAIYMGRAAAPEIARKLIAAGRDPATPVMVAVNVSQPSERLLRGRLDALAFLVRTIGRDDPTLLLIGDAVALGTAARPTSGRGKDDCLMTGLPASRAVLDTSTANAMSAANSQLAIAGNATANAAGGFVTESGMVVEAAS